MLSRGRQTELPSGVLIRVEGRHGTFISTVVMMRKNETSNAMRGYQASSSDATGLIAEPMSWRKPW